MLHNREEVIQRTIAEFELLDHLVASLSDEDCERLLPRPISPIGRLAWRDRPAQEVLAWHRQV